MNEPATILNLTNLFGALILGGIVGFVYAYRRVARDQQAIIARNVDLLGRPGEARGHFRGTLMGYRLGAGTIGAIVGAVGGAVILALAGAAILFLR